MKRDCVGHQVWWQEGRREAEHSCRQSKRSPEAARQQYNIEYSSHISLDAISSPGHQITKLILANPCTLDELVYIRQQRLH